MQFCLLSAWCGLFSSSWWTVKGGQTPDIPAPPEHPKAPSIPGAIAWRMEGLPGRESTVWNIIMHLYMYIYMYIYISSEIVGRAARCHTQNTECCSSRGKKSLKMGVWGPAEVAATIVLLHTTEKIMKRVSRAFKNKNQLPGAVFTGTIL